VDSIQQLDLLSEGHVYHTDLADDNQACQTAILPCQAGKSDQFDSGPKSQSKIVRDRLLCPELEICGL